MFTNKDSQTAQSSIYRASSFPPLYMKECVVHCASWIYVNADELSMFSSLRSRYSVIVYPHVVHCASQIYLTEKLMFSSLHSTYSVIVYSIKFVQ